MRRMRAIRAHKARLLRAMRIRNARTREERRSLAFYTRGRRRQGGRGQTGRVQRERERRERRVRQKERGGQDDDVHRREDSALFPERANGLRRHTVPKKPRVSALPGDFVAVKRELEGKKIKIKRENDMLPRKYSHRDN